MSKIRILIADDHNLFRTMLFHMLNDEDDIEVVGEAHDGREAVNLCVELKPDIVILDVNMPVMDGLEAIRIILDNDKTIKVVILTAIEDDDYIFKFIREGATAYLLKDTTPNEMLKTIRSAYSGDSVVQGRVMNKILKEFCKLSQQSETIEKTPPEYTCSDSINTLTDREKEVLNLVAKGLNNKEIAANLYISETTVKTHVSNLMNKLEKRDRIELVLYALRCGFSRLS